MSKKTDLKHRKKSRTGSEKKRSLKNRESVRKPEKGRAVRRKDDEKGETHKTKR